MWANKITVSRISGSKENNLPYFFNIVYPVSIQVS